MRSRLFVLALLSVVTSFAMAQEIQGAKALLKRLEEAKAAPKEDSPAQIFEASLNNGQSDDPKQSAAWWFSVHDRWRTLTTDPMVSTGMGSSADYGKVIGALPAPEAWPEIRALAEARKSGSPLDDALLRLVSHTLTADPVAQREDLTTIRRIIAESGDKSQGEYLEGQLSALQLQLAKQSGDIGAMVSLIEAAITKPPSRSYYNPFANAGVPDLVTHLGPDRAESVLTRLLLGAKQQLSVPEGLKTKALARKIALANMDKLQVPHWSLVEGPDAVELYEAFDRRFPAKPEDQIEEYNPYSSYSGGTRVEARNAYLIALILRGDNEKANAVLSQMKNDEEEYTASLYFSLDALTKSGNSRAIATFLLDYLNRNPEVNQWDTLIWTASSSGMNKELVAMVESTLKRQDLKKDTRNSLESHLAKALLAGERHEEGVTLIRKIAQERREMSDGITLAQLGKALNRPDLLEEGLSVASRPNAKSATTAMHPYYAQQLADLYLDLGRYAEAEASYFKAIEMSHREDQYGMGQDSSNYKGLVRVYHAVGRHQDVIDLVEKVPGWGVSDVAELIAQEYYATGEQPIGYFIASSLHNLGRTDEARRVIMATLRKELNYDPSYELLIEIEGQNALPILDQLAARDRFQERPLIWKGQLLLDAGRIPEAEQTIKTAISIDPSDGETKFGNRMKVYSVYADILEAKGETSQAEVYRGAMKAIRLAEQADVLNLAGLTSLAINMYKDSLNYFESAYCIQSRLAVDLAAVGRYEEAEKHYRRAYELMPDSFGRLESHCFGCEMVFAGELAQNLAEEVFTRLLTEQPNKPQVHYLLGYLRKEQGRIDEAMALFRKAAELDPDYMSAWKAMSEIANTMTLPLGDMQSVALAMFRLDPLMVRTQPAFDYVTDLEALYRLAEKAVALVEPDTEPVLEMTASKRQVDEMKKLGGYYEEYADYSSPHSGWSGLPKRPGAILTKSPILQGVIQLQSSASGMTIPDIQ